MEKLHHNAFGNTFARNFNYGTSSDNRLEKISIGSTDYDFTYDANGNRTEYANKRYFYDAADQLIAYQLLDGGGNVVTQAYYLYAGGERVKKVVVDVASGETEETVYIEGVFEQRINRNGDVQNRLHVMDGSARIAQRRVGTPFADELPQDILYNLEDHLNNSTHTVSDTGAFLSKEEYYSFGETAYGSYSKKRYRFNGKELDSESGLYYYGMRYYAPWTCRFVNVDPIWDQYPFYTPYQYAGNEPIANRDLDGLEPGGSAKNTGGNQPAANGQTVKRSGTPTGIINSGSTESVIINGVSGGNKSQSSQAPESRNALTIYVNGYWDEGVAGDIIDSKEGGEGYWGGEPYFKAAEEFLGTTGGAREFVDGNTGWTSAAKYGSFLRYLKGYAYVIENLDKYESIKESTEISVVTHSFGVAYGAGMVAALNNNDISVNTVVHLSGYLGFNGTPEFDTPTMPETYQFGMANDPVVNEDAIIAGVDRFAVAENEGKTYKEEISGYSHGSTKGSSKTWALLAELKRVSELTVQNAVPVSSSTRGPNDQIDLNPNLTKNRIEGFSWEHLTIFR